METFHIRLSIFLLLGIAAIFSADQRQDDLNNQLFHAVQNSMPEDVERLLDAGADKDASYIEDDYWQVSVLKHAIDCDCYREQNALLLISRRAVVHSDDLNKAASVGSRKITRALLDRGLRPTDELLDNVVCHGNLRIDVIRDLLAGGARIADHRTGGIWTVLGYARHRRFDELVQLLEDYQQRGTQALEDFDREHPHLDYVPQRLSFQEQAKLNRELLEGIRDGMLTVEQIRTLVKAGADIESSLYNPVSYFYETALTQALNGTKGVRSSHAEEIALLLIGLGALVNTSRIPLHCAVDAGFERVVEALIAKEVDINALSSGHRGRAHESALHRAAIKGHVAIAQKLIAAGADKSLRNQLGETAALLAKESGHSALAQVLAEGVEEAFIVIGKGAHRSGDGDLYQVVVFEGADLHRVRDLLGKRARPTYRPWGRKQTVLEYAREHQLHELVQLLEDYLQHGAQALEDFDKQHP